MRPCLKTLEKAPSSVAPSPKKHTATASSLFPFIARAAPAAIGIVAPTIGTEPQNHCPCQSDASNHQDLFEQPVFFPITSAKKACNPPPIAKK